jgi:hypothetical protein
MKTQSVVQRRSKAEALNVATRLKNRFVVVAILGFGALSVAVGGRITASAAATHHTASGSSTTTTRQNSSNGSYFDQSTGGASFGRSTSSSSGSSSAVSGTSVS